MSTYVYQQQIVDGNDYRRFSDAVGAREKGICRVAAIAEPFGFVVEVDDEQREAASAAMPWLGVRPLNRAERRARGRAGS